MTKVLITGICGFIGHHLAAYLLRETDWLIVGLDRIDSAGDQNRITPDPRLVVVHHDLRAELNPGVSQIVFSGRYRFDSGPFDYIAHLSAASHVERSVVDPIGFVQDNVIGTAHLLEFARKCLRHGGKTLYFSTDEVFGPAPEGVSFGPYDPHTPNNPYAGTKSAAESLCPAWVNTFGLPIITSHCTNVFGEQQHPEKFIPMLIEKIRRGEKILIHADKTKTRPSSRFYTYVENVCSAVLTLLREPYKGYEKFNISGGEEISNLVVAQKVAELLGKPLKYELVDFVPGRPRHDQRYAVDDSSLRELGWAPHVTFEEGLRRVVNAS